MFNQQWVVRSVRQLWDCYCGISCTSLCLVSSVSCQHDTAVICCWAQLHAVLPAAAPLLLGASLSISPGLRTLSSKHAAAAGEWWDRPTDRQMDTWPFHSSCSAYYASSVWCWLCAEDATSRFDCVFWLGDLNSRMQKGREQLEMMLGAEQDGKLVDFDDIVRHDELKSVIDEGKTRPKELYTLLLLLLLLLLHLYNSLFSRTTWISRYQKGKISLDLNESRDDGVLGCSGICWTICKQSAPCFRQITAPTPITEFLKAGCSSYAQSTVSKHWMQSCTHIYNNNTTTI